MKNIKKFGLLFNDALTGNDCFLEYDKEKYLVIRTEQLDKIEAVHLSVEQLKELIPYLQYFVDNGSFPIDELGNIEEVRKED